MIRYAESMGMIERQPHPLGDIMRMSADRAVLATYYRNNILHLFAMPSLLACCFIGNARMRSVDIQRLVWRVYPFIRAELALRWPEADIGAVDRLASRRIRPLEAAPGQRGPQRVAAPGAHLARGHPAVVACRRRRFKRSSAITWSSRFCCKAGSGNIGQQALEQRCHLMAQRMSLLYGLNSPEFFDRSLFRNFIELLCRREVITASDDGTLSFGEPLLGVAADAQLVLSEQIRHDILQVTLGQ